MGMFDKDKDFAKDGILKNVCPSGSKFVLYDCWIQNEEFDTGTQFGENKDGKAVMSHLEIGLMAKPEEHLVVSAIGDAIGNKVKEKSDGDLPAVCETHEVESRTYDRPAFILRFIEPYNPTGNTAKAGGK